ncbi:MAG: hypothetical protein K8I82_20415 [Anaerolineae bacterium]|nr:hypothetical protein [Anaerolineae bacterium]
MNDTLFSLRFQRTPPPDLSAATQVESWLHRWGILYQRNVAWHTYDATHREQFHFTLAWVILPSAGRQPTDYLLLEILPDASSSQRNAARHHLLKALWPGRMLMLEAPLLRTDPQTAQLRLLNAL